LGFRASGTELGGGFKTVVLGRSEDPKDVLATGARGLHGGDGRDVGEGDGDAETGSLLILVDGEQVRAED
jgi:hypothetical protein